MTHQRAGKHRRDDLRRHGEGVVIAGEFADVAAAAHLQHHRERVDVDGRPRKAHEGKADEHDGMNGRVERGEEIEGQEHRGEQGAAEEDGLFAADARGELTDGNVADDRAGGGNEQAGGRAAEPLSHDRADVGGPPGRYTVVADVPQRDGHEQKAKAPLDGLGQHLIAAAVVLGEVPLGMLRLERARLRGELRLLHRQEQHRDAHEHDGGNDEEKRLIVDVGEARDLGVRVHHRRDSQIDDAADGAHEVDDGVRA